MARLEQFPPVDSALADLMKWGLLPIGWIETLDHILNGVPEVTPFDPNTVNS